MKSIYLSAAALCIGFAGNAQLFSSGNNMINGSNVGIGTNNPTDRLEIKSNYDPLAPVCISCPAPTPPGIRFTTDLVGSINPTTYYWDIDAEEHLTFQYKMNSGTFSEVLSMNDDVVTLSTAQAYISPDVQVHSSPGISGTTALLSFGASYNSNSNAWSHLGTNSNGSAILARDGGGFEVITGISNNSYTDNALVVKSDGNVGIGVENPTSKLEISDGDLRIKEGRFVIGNGTQNQFEVNKDGYVIAREILVDMDEAIPDYVFDDAYPLMPLDQLRTFINTHKHLPNIPSAKEYEALGGIEVGELSRLLLEKQEELLLYILALEDRLQAVESSNMD